MKGFYGCGLEWNVARVLYVIYGLFWVTVV